MPTSSSTQDPLTRFLTGGPDSRGRTREDILAWSDRELELHHDYIQWLFPLPEPSRAVPGSPVLTASIRDALADRVDVIDGMRAATARMRSFYESNDHWLVTHDHNHLRISRIIRSLRLMVGDADADAFRAAILDRVAVSGTLIPLETRNYWQGA